MMGNEENQLAAGIEAIHPKFQTKFVSDIFQRRCSTFFSRFVFDES